MKKKTFSVMALIIGLILSPTMIGCDIGGGPDGGNPMDGMWRDNATGKSIIFSGANFTMQTGGVNDVKGRFSFYSERTQITFYVLQKWENNTWVAYSETHEFFVTIPGNSFTITNRPGGISTYNGTYTKL